MRPPIPLLRTLILLAFLIVPGERLAAQRVAVGDPLEDYARVISLLDSAPHISFAIRPLSDSAWGSVLEGPTHLWAAAVDDQRLGAFHLTPMAFRSTFNSKYASGQNDGLLWQGKGLNTLVEAGATLRKGHFEVTLRPQFTWSANEAFPLASVIDSGRSDYANPWHPYAGKGGNLDVPQRMGPDAYSKMSWGESSARVRAGGWAFGASSEEMWWGPAQQNPIVLSNNAPGFAHAFLGTIRPVALPGFRFETQWIWGSLHNSGWSDSIPSNRTRFATGLVASIQPNVLPGLSLGGSRTYYMNSPPGGISTGDIFIVFQGFTKRGLATDSNLTGNDKRDQLLTLFARYAPPGSGFEAYIEWGRNDHSWDLRDFLMEPEHASASTIGFQKAVRLKNSQLIRVAGEWTNLQRSLTQLVRPIPSWYTHHIVLDGWTQEGQFLGAPIGTGSDGQTLWGDLFAHWGRAGLLLQRVARDNDALYNILAGNVFEDFESHQVEIRVQGSGMVFWRGLEIEGALGWEKTFNRYMVYTNDVTNLHVELGIRSRLPHLP
jgi:hypothetical protein